MNEKSDILQVQGINSKGFGMIPKLAMQDKRLTIQSKAIYAYFCSYAGAGKTAFPSRTKIISDLGISKDNYYKHFNLLKECGYIKVEQEKGKAGQFKRNIYTMTEYLPCPKFSDTVENHTPPCPNLPYTATPDTVKQDTNNNRFKNKQSFKNNSLSSPSEKEDGQDEDETALKIQMYADYIKNGISYNDLAISRKYDMQMIDEFVAIILDAVMTESKTVCIGNEDKPRELVKHNLLKLNYDDIEYAIDQFRGYPKRIIKKKQFILTMLYNSKMERDSHYTNLYESNKRC